MVFPETLQLCLQGGPTHSQFYSAFSVVRPFVDLLIEGTVLPEVLKSTKDSFQNLTDRSVVLSSKRVSRGTSRKPRSRLSRFGQPTGCSFASDFAMGLLVPMVPPPQWSLRTLKGEAMSTRTDQLLEQYGVDTDEDCGQTLPLEFSQ